jgi:hypothetical protein
LAQPGAVPPMMAWMGRNTGTDFNMFSRVSYCIVCCAAFIVISSGRYTVEKNDEVRNVFAMSPLIPSRTDFTLGQSQPRTSAGCGQSTLGVPPVLGLAEGRKTPHLKKKNQCL